jgi:hypothetical protein
MAFSEIFTEFWKNLNFVFEKVKNFPFFSYLKMEIFLFFLFSSLEKSVNSEHFHE